MRRALLLAVLALPLGPLTSLSIEPPGLPAPRAGEAFTTTGHVALFGPLGPLPGVAGPVQLVASGGPANCTVAPSLAMLDPVSGRAAFDLTCRPKRPGHHDVTVHAGSPPHGPADWNATLVVGPDALQATLAADPPSGYELPVHVAVSPQNLDAAPVNVTLEGRLRGSPLGFVEPAFAANVSPGTIVARTLVARHGPGTYDLAARVEGPWTEPTVATANVTVPAPPRNAVLALNVTVAPGEPAVELTGDSVNDDGKNKRPGETLTTRLRLAHTNTAEVSVERVAGNDTVVLASTTVLADAGGRAEHAFTWPTLPSGLLIVRATAGNSSVARTAQVRDVASEAVVTGPDTLLADGRALALSLVVEDANFGSTPEDPGPVWGLPALTWRVFKGSRTDEGWSVRVGPFDGGSEGAAGLDRVAWPHGAEAVDVASGRAQLAVELLPPPGATEGSRRLSLYDQDGDRVGGHTFTLVPPPVVAIATGEPVPGEDLLAHVSVADPLPDTRVNVSLDVPGHPTVHALVDGPGPVHLPVPEALPAGTPVRVSARGEWSGRPVEGPPDATLVLAVPALAPRLSAWPSLDGLPTPGPLALHPGAPHEVSVAVDTTDPNGDPVTVDATVVGPDDAPVPWPITPGDQLALSVPEGAAAGRYHLELVARAADGETTERVALDVGGIVRVAVEGPRTLAVAEGETAHATLVVHNRGTVALDGLVLSADGPDGLVVTVASDATTVGPDEVLAVGLAPGDVIEVTLGVAAETEAAGGHALRLVVAGVVG